MTESRVVVLGGGIAGCLIASRLADSGYQVTLVDRNERLMSAASRWNEGKIHLGFTYTGTSSLDSARLMIEGAGVFESIIEQITGTAIAESWYSDRVVYLVDPASQFSAEVLWKRANAVADLLARHAETQTGLRRYLADGPMLRWLKPEAAAAATGLGRIAAAWETPERAIAPGPVAELVRSAVAERNIEVIRAGINAVRRIGNAWEVDTDAGSLRAAVVANCTWESRPMIDATQFDRFAPVSIRFKYGLFGSGLRRLTDKAPSTRIIGPFGDITPYGNGQAYLTWYPAGLAGLSDDGIPPTPALMDREALIAETLAGLGVDRSILEEPHASWEVAGGYIVAHGYGDIVDAQSPLHDRSCPGARELAPGYVSVDTGKYSLGPLIAQRAVELICRRLAGYDGAAK